METITEDQQMKMYQELKEYSLNYIQDVYVENGDDEEVTEKDLNLVVEEQLRNLSARSEYADLTDSEYEDLQYCVWEDICESYCEDEVLVRELL